MPWIIEEATKRAEEQFKNRGQIEMAMRKAKKAFDKYENVKVKWVDEVKDKSIDQNTIRLVVRNMNKNNAKLDQIIPKLDQIFVPLQNLQILSVLNTALAAANLVATVAGMVVICNKLNSMDHKLDAIQKEIAAVQNFNNEMQINNPCSKMIDDYKMLEAALKRGKPVPEAKIEELINNCKVYINSIYNLQDSLSMDSALSMMFTLLPIMANCIMIYYRQFYDPDQGAHPLHDGWMKVFDNLSAPEFMDRIQDYLFIEKNMTNRQVNEYLDCQRLLIYSYRTRIEELLADLKACGNKEAYDDVMIWCKQYVAQQAKTVQAELESKIGAERAKVYIDQATLEAAL